MIFFCWSFPIHGENKDKDLVMLLYTGKYRKRKGGGGDLVCWNILPKSDC